MRESVSRTMTFVSMLTVLAATILIAACSTTKDVYRKESFQENTPFSETIRGPGDTVCWSVKRALLSQGYMLDHSADSVTLTGTKDFQTDDDTDVTLRFQASCADNHDGTSTVFATAMREINKIQERRQTRSVGVSIATVTWPAGNEKVLQVVKRETVRDQDFYQRFYTLVKNYAAQDQDRGDPRPR